MLQFGDGLNASPEVVDYLASSGGDEEGQGGG